MGEHETRLATATPAHPWFAATMERCQAPLYGFLRGLVRDPEIARDLVQDTFCVAWARAISGGAPFAPEAAPDLEGVRRWLFHAAYNRAISVHRRRRLIRWLSLDATEGGDTAEDMSEASLAFENRLIEAQVVRTALAALAPADAACLWLIAVHDFTAAEVAEIVGSSPAAVAKRYARAKLRLRDAYTAAERPHPARSAP